jgi:hypothetical protein
MKKGMAINTTTITASTMAAILRMRFMMLLLSASAGFRGSGVQTGYLEFDPGILSKNNLCYRESKVNPVPLGGSCQFFQGIVVAPILDRGCTLL